MGVDETQVFVWTNPGKVATSEMGMGSWNVLVSVSSLVTAAPIGTDPKSSDGGVALKGGAGTVTGIIVRTLLPDVELVRDDRTLARANREYETILFNERHLGIRGDVADSRRLCHANELSIGKLGVQTDRQLFPLIDGDLLEMSRP